MDKIKVGFYRKLNEYYQERDYLFTRKSYRGHAYSLLDFLIFFITASILLVLGIVLSIIYKDIIDLLLFFALSFIPYLISLLIISITCSKESKEFIEQFWMGVLEKFYG